jgi:hypothetical protein
VVVAVDASGVHARQDRDAVPGPAGYFWGGNARVELEGHAAVP